jgi:hypothetical protein
VVPLAIWVTDVPAHSTNLAGSLRSGQVVLTLLPTPLTLFGRKVGIQPVRPWPTPN